MKKSKGKPKSVFNIIGKHKMHFTINKKTINQRLKSNTKEGKLTLKSKVINLIIKDELKPIFN